MNGISWGLKEDVPLDVDKFREHYLDMVTKFNRKLDRFIEITQGGGK